MPASFKAALKLHCVKQRQSQGIICSKPAQKLYYKIALSSCRLINGLKGQHTELKDARFLFYGAGSSAVGVAQLLALLLQKKGGQSEEQAWKVGPLNQNFTHKFPTQPRPANVIYRPARDTSALTCAGCLSITKGKHRWNWLALHSAGWNQFRVFMASECNNLW